MKSKEIPGYNGDYNLFEDGSCYSTRRKVGKYLMPIIGVNGATYYRFYNDEKTSKQILIARLVLTLFDRPPEPGEHACHIDGNKYNNRIENLKWTSLKSTKHRKHPVYCKELNKTFKSLVEAGEYININPHTLNNYFMRGKTYKGYTFITKK
jgi:hypothetical protein